MSYAYTDPACIEVSVDGEFVYSYGLNGRGYRTSNGSAETFAYCPLGYIYKVESSGIQPPSGVNFRSTRTYTWEEGSVADINTETTRSPLTPYHHREVYGYGQVEHLPATIDLGWLLTEARIAQKGWFGVATLLLPSRIDHTGVDADGVAFDYTEQFRYELDGKGYPVKIYRREIRTGFAQEERLFYEIAYK
jgi:hypothetical protein